MHSDFVGFVVSQLKLRMNLNLKYVHFIDNYFSMRQDVFDVIVAFEKKGVTDLTPEEKRYVERMIKYGRRNGKTETCYDRQ